MRIQIRPCHCDDQSKCRRCWLFHNDPRYNRLWGGNAPKTEAELAKERECGETMQAVIGEITAGRIPAGAKLVSGEAVVVAGPGTKLAELLRELGFSSCGLCGEWIQRMEEWGVEGCREHREEIINRLKEAWGKITWGQTVAALGRAVVGAFRPNPLDVCGSLVDEAIRRAGSSQ